MPPLNTTLEKTLNLNNFLSLTLALLPVLVFSSCGPTASKLDTLSREELAKCGIFNGKRLLFMVNPDDNFAADVDHAQKTFLKQMTEDNRFTQYSYFTDAEGNISDPCIFYVATQQAKYEVGAPALTGEFATKENLRKHLEMLGRRIATLRQEAAQTLAAEAQESFQVQIILAISSHGDKVDDLHPEGKIALSDNEDISYKEFSELLTHHLLTPCSAPNCQTPATNRRADEITILMDNCYSGKFQVGLKNHLSAVLGYHQPLTHDSRSHATRIFSFTSSQEDFLSTGTYLNSDRSTLFELFSMALNYWLADGNGDNLITMNELSHFITVESEPALLSDAVESFAEQIAKVVKDAELRDKVMLAYRTKKPMYEFLFADPLAALKKHSWFGGRVGIQAPTFFANTDDVALDHALFAVRGPSAMNARAVNPEAMTRSAGASTLALQDMADILEKIIAYLEKNPKVEGMIKIDDLDLGSLRPVLSAIMNEFTGGGQDEDEDEDEDEDDEEEEEEDEDESTPATVPGQTQLIKKTLLVVNQDLKANEALIFNGHVESAPTKGSPAVCVFGVEGGAEDVALSKGTKIKILSGYVFSSGPVFTTYILDHPLVKRLTCYNADSDETVAGIVGDVLTLQ